MYAHIKDKDAISIVRNSVLKLLQEKNVEGKKIVVLCIGTDRCTGDSYGPFVGMMLNYYKDINKLCKVYGTLEKPVHARNLEETINSIDLDNSFVIAIDASLGDSSNVEYINVKDSMIKPGMGVGKEFTAIGDIAIHGIVNLSGNLAFTVLQNTRLYIVHTMAMITSKAVAEAILIYKRQERENIANNMSCLA